MRSTAVSTRRRIASITVVSYVPVEETAADSIAAIIDHVAIHSDAQTVAVLKQALMLNCMTENKARLYSKYKRARKVRLTITLDEIPSARGFKKRYKKKLTLVEPHVNSLTEQVEDNT